MNCSCPISVAGAFNVCQKVAPVLVWRLRRNLFLRYAPSAECPLDTGRKGKRASCPKASPAERRAAKEFIPLGLTDVPQRELDTNNSFRRYAAFHRVSFGDALQNLNPVSEGHTAEGYPAKKFISSLPVGVAKNSLRRSPERRFTSSLPARRFISSLPDRSFSA